VSRRSRPDIPAKPPETRRKRPERKDLDVYARLFGDARVAATLWPGAHGGPRTAAQAQAMLEADDTHWEAHGFGPWLHRLADGTAAARGGLWRTVVDGAAETEVQYAVASELWGRGLATEIARAAVGEAFESLGLATLVCFTLPSNEGSRRVMEKAGFEYERDFVRAGLPHVLYRLTN